MPCPHYKIKISSRAKGHCAVAQAAYQSGDRLYDERTQCPKNYSEKHGIIYTEILLPSNAPREYEDRNTLWNSVEAVEENWNSQLARRFEIALPRELTIEKGVELIRNHCLEQFVSQGMIADIAVHDPNPPGHNPHAHVMLTMRPMDGQGKWMEKAHKEYVLDDNGNRIRTAKGNWKSIKVETTDWNSRSNADKWRQAWEDMQNQYLEAANRPERISMKSYKSQGIDQIPTVHMGAAVTAMERRGIETDIGKLNNEIRETNKLLAAIKRAISGLTTWLEEIKEAISEVEAQPKEVYLVDLLIQRFEKRKAERRENWDSKYGAKRADIKDFQRFADITAYLRGQEILTVADLDSHMTEIQARALPLKKRISVIEKRISTIEKFQKTAARYRELNPIHDQYMKIHWKSRQQKFAEEHKDELDEWNKANRYLRKNLPDMDFQPKVFAEEQTSLNAELSKLKEQIAPINEEISMMKSVRYYVKDLLPELVPEGEALTEERKDEKRESIKERLTRAKQEVEAHEAERHEEKETHQKAESRDVL